MKSHNCELKVKKFEVIGGQNWNFLRLNSVFPGDERPFRRRNLCRVSGRAASTAGGYKHSGSEINIPSHA